MGTLQAPCGHRRDTDTPSGAVITGPKAGTFARVRTFGRNPVPPRSLTRSLTRSLLLLAVTGAMAAGCGTADDPARTDASTTSPGVTSTPDPTPERTPEATPEATAPAPEPTETEPPGGSGDGEGDGTPATAGGGICSDLEPSDVGKVLGGAVTGAGLPPGGCEFTQQSARAPSATFVESSYAATPGGMSGAKTNATSSVEGEPRDLSGIGSAAFVVTGTVFGGDEVQGAGAVRVGDRLVQVTLSQRTGLSAAAVRALVVGILELAADQAA